MAEQRRAHLTNAEEPDEEPACLDLRSLVGRNVMYRAFGLHLGGHFAGAAAFRLACEQHATGVPAQIVFNAGGPEVRSVVWDPPESDAGRVYADEERATEDAAIAVAALVSCEVLGYAVVSSTAKRDDMNRPSGFDYWIDRNPDADPLLACSARLEVSGIKNGSEKVPNRVREKAARLESYAARRRADGQEPDPQPVFIVVVEFGTPIVSIHRHDRS
jgi:hypothetical protein